MNYHYSFKDWCIDNNRVDLLNRWDYDLNNKKPEDIGFQCNEKMFFVCPNLQHDSCSYTICDITNGKNKLIKCKYCNSFAQKIIDDYGSDYLNRVWNNQNKKTHGKFHAIQIKNSFLIANMILHIFIQKR